jgi:hypothetical protein
MTQNKIRFCVPCGLRPLEVWCRPDGGWMMDGWRPDAFSVLQVRAFCVQRSFRLEEIGRNKRNITKRARLIGRRTSAQHSKGYEGVYTGRIREGRTTRIREKPQTLRRIRSMFGCSESKFPISMGFVWAERMVVRGPPCSPAHGVLVTVIISWTLVALIASSTRSWPWGCNRVLKPSITPCGLMQRPQNTSGSRELWWLMRTTLGGRPQTSLPAIISQTRTWSAALASIGPNCPAMKKTRTKEPPWIVILI